MDSTVRDVAPPTSTFRTSRIINDVLLFPIFWFSFRFSLDKDFPSFYNKNKFRILFLRRLFFVRRASAFSFRHDKNEIAYLFLRMEKEVSRGLYHF